jgi:colanic acid biosynthesis glycosyl transferase WcaI
MRILIVSQYFHPETFRINDIAESLVEQGHTVSVYCGLPNYLLGRFFPGYSFLGPYRENWRGVEIIRVPIVPRGKKIGPRLILNYLSYFIIGSIIAPFKIKDDFDVIFVYGLSPVTLAIPAVVLKKKLKVPTLMWVTDLWPESLKATGVLGNERALRFIGKMVSWIYSHMDKIYISSKGFKKPIQNLNVPEHKIDYWPYWAEDFFSAKEKADVTDWPENINDNDFVVMFAGNIGRAQDFETVLQAAEKLKENTQIKFVVLGDGQKKEWASTYVRDKAMNKTFYLLGRRALEQMPAYYKKASAMLVCLRDEEIFSLTVPSKLQSYVAAGKPIISSVNGETAEIVTRWNLGVAAKAGSADDLADKIKKMAHLSQEELNILAQNARQCYQEEFNKGELLKKLVADLTSLSTRGSAHD